MKPYDLTEPTPPKEFQEIRLTWLETLKIKFAAWREKRKVRKYLKKGITPAGAPTWDRESKTWSTSEAGAAYSAIIRPRSEVIAPAPDDTAEILAGLISQAACDHEFPRVIVYPIGAPLKQCVLELLAANPERYPMFEYRPANIITNHDLDSNSIIYKYGGRTHFTKPV